MVYPVLQINQDDSTMNVILTDTNDESELILYEPEDTACLFFDLLDMFLSQYDAGYERGYGDACEDNEIDEDMM